ncbi:TetR/AcrR family transcriptional regulator [Marimonas sp. MJW-29]|uniref:TetR/AcrR family transcriptional regulator n=1 Tax=Sulfitobacter sediminis TaxID=3234186 RepID=A0ABV3RTL1_9RHOB
MTTPKTRRERNLAEIRERALPLAERIVLDEGMAALNARRLARDLGVSVGSLYNAFGDLPAVVRAVIDRSSQMLADRLHDAVAAAKPEPRARVMALGVAYLEFAIAEPRRWWLLFEYRNTVSPDRKVEEFQIGLLDMLIEAGGGDPRSESSKQFFLLLWASVHGLVSLACRPTIVAIDPEMARTFVGELVNSGFDRYPTD